MFMGLKVMAPDTGNSKYNIIKTTKDRKQGLCGSIKTFLLLYLISFSDTVWAQPYYID